MTEPPRQRVLRDFGLEGDPVPLGDGFDGTTFLVEDSVLKQFPPDQREFALWNAEFLNRVTERGFRISRPKRTLSGAWISEGWSATTYLEGTHEYHGRVEETIKAIRAFHDVTRLEEWPACLALPDGDNLFYRADRMAWGEERPARINLGLDEPIAQLLALRQPLEGIPSQLIHGDINPSNVLIHPGLAPGLIDMTPYWRPKDYALAIYALWISGFQNNPDLLCFFEEIPNFDQFLLRAELRTLFIRSELNIESDMELYWQSSRVVAQWVSR